MPAKLTADEFAAELERRGCAPLTKVEADVLVELLRRATGGVVLMVPNADLIPPERLPAAWLAELAAIVMPHYSKMMALGRRRNPPPYDPMPSLVGVPMPWEKEQASAEV